MTDVMLRPRSTSRSRRRRTRRVRRTAGILAGMIALAAIAAGGVLLATRSTPAPPGTAIGQTTDGEQLTVLIASSLSSDLSQRADALTLFAADRATGADPLALFIPTGTFGQIPGQSSIEQIGKALTFGRESLQEITVENLLGVSIDRTLVLDDVQLARMIERMGGLDITVTDRVFETDAAGRSELVFPLGEQHMDGPDAVTYLTYRGEGETDLDRMVRAQHVWQAVVDLAERDLEGVRAAILDLDGIGPADAGAFADLIGAFATAPEDDRTFDVLAVESAGGSSIDAVYELDASGVAAQRTAGLAGSLLEGVGVLDERPRVELRNGVGVPEVGSSAASSLVPAGFKIEVTGNTSSFGNATTRIVVYGEDEASIALGERVRSLLGVGEVEVGVRGQTVVDLTVVIGRDFVDRKA